MGGNLLVIDDDEPTCRLVRATFKAEGVNVLIAHDGPAGLARVQADEPDVVLLDLRLPSASGIDVLEQLKRTNPSLPVVMLTASREIKTAVRATQLGAFDYLTKPIEHDEIVAVVRRALDARALHLEVEDLRTRVARNEADQLAFEMGTSTRVRELVEQIATVARSNFSVLIVGETGTGKELVAQAIHRQSDRRRQPFIALDCGAIPEPLLESELFGHERGAFTGAERRRAGHFQLAAGGTCFLDEIGNLPATQQAKLLRVLESREVHPVGAERPTTVDIRFIAAANEDLQPRAHGGYFRADLYFRLAQYTIALSPLRQRPEDIAHLAQRFLEEACIELRKPGRQFAPAAIEMLRRHDWPGNARELRNVVRQAVLRSDALAIKPTDLRALLTSTPTPASGAITSTPMQSLKEIGAEAARTAERDAICDALRTTEGNRSRAANLLQTDYKTLLRKIGRLGIRVRDFHSVI
jgi:two-component system, NtrC family, response regulator HydG